MNYEIIGQFNDFDTAKNTLNKIQNDNDFLLAEITVDEYDNNLSQKITNPIEWNPLSLDIANSYSNNDLKYCVHLVADQSLIKKCSNELEKNGAVNVLVYSF